MNTLKKWKSNTSTKTSGTSASTVTATSSDGEGDGIPEEYEPPQASTSRGSGGLSDVAIEPSPSAGSPDKLRLSLLQRSSTITPGTVLQGQVDVGSLKDCKTLRLQLTGKCACTIMGKMRYQAAIGVQSFGGAGFGGAAPITFRESHTFLNVEQVLWNIDEPEIVHQSAGGEKPSSSSSIQDGKIRFDITMTVPSIKMCQCEAVTYALPPSIDLRHFSPDAGIIDTSTIEVKYSLAAVLERKGFLKRKQKAKIPLRIVDDAPPGYTSNEEVHGVNKGPFKYASSQESGGVPELEMLLSFVPPSTRDATISYSVSYRIADGSSPPFPSNSDTFDDGTPLSPPPMDAPDLPPLYQASSAPLLSTLNPRMEVTLSRANRTRPIERQREGTEFAFAPIVIALGKNNDDGPSANNGTTASEGNTRERNARTGHNEVSGSIKVPKNEVTMFSCGAEVSHFLQARMYSSALKRPIIVRCKVYLPSGEQ